MKHIIVAVFLIFLFVSCASAFGVTNLESRVGKLEIGMKRNKALEIIGNNYTVVSNVKTDEGVIETVRVINAFEDILYHLYFQNGELVEYHEGMPRYASDIHIIR